MWIDFIFPSLYCHIVEIEVIGPGSENSQFSVKTLRSNPAKSEAVTGNATYASFLSSVIGENILLNVFVDIWIKDS